MRMRNPRGYPLDRGPAKERGTSRRVSPGESGLASIRARAASEGMTHAGSESATAVRTNSSVPAPRTCRSERRDAAGPACGRGSDRAANAASVATMGAPGGRQSTWAQGHYSWEGSGAPTGRARERSGRLATDATHRQPIERVILLGSQSTEDKPVRLISAEDPILFKLLAGRPRDLLDIEDIVFMQGQLDGASMRRWAGPLGVADQLEGMLGKR